MTSPLHPMRKPTWRWEAVQAASVGLGTIDRSDPWMRDALSFWMHYVDPRAKGKATLDYPSTWRAYSIFNDSGDCTMRWVVEALVMARIAPDDIAANLPIDSEDVSAYEHLFFDVRDRLHLKHWVQTAILGPAIVKGMQMSDPDLCWKYMAYFFGPKMLEALMDPRIVPDNQLDVMRQADEVEMQMKAHVDWRDRLDMSKSAMLLDIRMRVLQASIKLRFDDGDDEGVEALRELIDSFKPIRASVKNPVEIKREDQQIKKTNAFRSAIQEELGKGDEDSAIKALESGDDESESGEDAFDVPGEREEAQ